MRLFTILRLSAPSSFRSFVAFSGVMTGLLVLGIFATPSQAQQALSSAVGSDGLTRILWDSTGGVYSLWRVNADTSVTPYNYGPFTGWTATQVAIGADNIPRILWNYSSGSCSIATVNETNGT